MNNIASGSRPNARPAGTALGRRPYEGSQRKLALAFDVGTTFSGVSYTLLDPGEVPRILTVTRRVLSEISYIWGLILSIFLFRYPAQENVGSDSKIPTILYYDRRGSMCAAGAEAMQESIIERAEDEGWHKAEWCVVPIAISRCR